MTFQLVQNIPTCKILANLTLVSNTLCQVAWNLNPMVTHAEEKVELFIIGAPLLFWDSTQI